MGVWPTEFEDTINYRTREFVSNSDVTIRMIDEAILSLWGNVFHNGQRLVFSPYVDLSTFGAKYDGSDEAPILQKAFDELPGFSHIHISGPLALGTPVVAKDTYTVTAEGWQSPITPTPGYIGGPMLEFRHNAGAAGSMFSHLAGIVMDNIVFDGKFRSVRAAGLRLNATQEGFFSRLRFNNLDGIGLQCYNSVRDSIFQSIMARRCANFDMGEPNVDITTHVGQSQDSHNNLCFLGLYSHIGAGDLMHLQCETTNNVRCFFFLGCKFHGGWLPGTVGSQDGIPYTHMDTARVVIRNARGVEFTNCRFHESAPGMPLIHMSAHPLVPGSASINHVGLGQNSLGNAAAAMIGDATGVANNEMKFIAPHYFCTGMMVRATATTISGVNLTTDYFIIRVDTNTIKLASTYFNAESGTAMVTGASGDVTLETQQFRVLIPELTYGRMYLYPGVDEDGATPRSSFINKSHIQVIEPFIGSKFLQPASYEGVITQNDLFNHIEVDGDLNHDGTKVGFYGTNPIVKSTVSAVATDATTTQTLANSLRTALVNLGLVQ